MVTDEIFKVSSRKPFFRLCDVDMQQTQTTSIIIEGGHVRIIPAKFVLNLALSFGDVL